MIARHQAWKLLGLKPCADPRAVKRAYAARLKAIDPDRDMQAFLRLREALEAAQADAYRRAQSEAGPPELAAREGEDFPETDEVEQAPQAHVVAVPDPEPQPAAEPELDPAAPVIEAIRSNLFPPAGEAGDPDELVSAVEALLADPRMGQVDFASDTEQWLATMAVQSGANSDPVLVRLATEFGWERQLDMARPNQYLLHLAHRSNDIRCMDALSDPDHRWHEAWIELRRPEPVDLPRPAKIHARAPMADLLASLDYNNPGVLARCNPEVVRGWRAAAAESGGEELVKGAGISWYGWVIIAWLVLVVTRALAGGW